jgi:uncharacterized membrane protein
MKQTRELLTSTLVAGLFVVVPLLLVLFLCFLVGRRAYAIGPRSPERMERGLFRRLPGYGLLRSLTQRLAGNTDGTAWQPAMVELEDALVPCFVIEELGDGRCTVFVPSVPTPFAGAVYVLNRERVHILDVPFTQAISSFSRWGAGSAELVASLRKEGDRPQGPTGARLPHLVETGTSPSQV